MQSTLPLACAKVDARILQAFRSSSTGDVEHNLALDVDRVRHLAWNLQALTQRQGCSNLTQQLAEHSMDCCASDAESLLLLDWLDESGLVLQALFIDDIRTRFSSPAAALHGSWPANVIKLGPVCVPWFRAPGGSGHARKCLFWLHTGPWWQWSCTKVSLLVAY